MKKTIFLFFMLISVAFADSNIAKVIQLHYQQAQTIIKLAQPLLQNGEKISGSGQTLVVNVSPATLTKLRALIHQLDQPPVTFQISIFQGDPDWLNQQDDTSWSISTNSQQQQQRSQSVQVMNGESAFISTGQDQPMITNIGFGWFSGGVNYQRQMVQNGLVVVPELQGQQVKLSVKRIRQQNNQVNNQTIDQQQVDTTVMVPLNKWVTLGSAQGSPQADDNTEVIRAGNQFTQNSTLYVKVTVTNNAGSVDP